MRIRYARSLGTDDAQVSFVDQFGVTATIYTGPSGDDVHQNPFSVTTGEIVVWIENGSVLEVRVTPDNGAPFLFDRIIVNDNTSDHDEELLTAALNRANHTGEQPIDTVEGLPAALASLNGRFGVIGNMADLPGQEKTNLVGALSELAAGLGTAAAKDTGDSSGDVPLLGPGGRLAISQIASGAPDGTQFVRDDGTLAVPPGGGGGSGDIYFTSSPSPLYGTGEDGDVTISTTVVLTRDMHYNSLTVTSTGRVRPDGYRIFVKNTCTVDGIIDADGGGAGYNQGPHLPPTTQNAGGAAGGGSNQRPLGLATQGSNANNTGAGVAAGAVNGSSSLGGSGGAGGASGGNPGGAGGAAIGTDWTTGQGGRFTGVWKAIPTRIQGGGAPAQVNGGAQFSGAINGGGGGGGSANDGSAPGAAGGGGGGGVIVLVARRLIVSGRVSADGGPGGLNAANNAGGGGGGGGGVVLVTCDAYTTTGTGAIRANGGAAGVGSGTGSNGIAGTNGTVNILATGESTVPAALVNSTRGYAAGRFYLPDGVGISANNYFAMVANRLYAAGVYCPRADATVQAWRINISAAGAGSTVRAGLWNVGPDGLPTTLHTDLGSGTGAVTTTLVVNTTATLLAGVPVILGLVSQGGSPQVPNVADTAGYRWGTENANANQVAQYGYSVIVAMGLASDGVSGALGAWPSTYVTGNAVAQPRAGLSF